MVLFCDICNVHVPSEACMATHRKGRRHIQLAIQQQKQQEQAEKSIYIRGFPKTITESAFQNYFLGFGSVSKVFIERKKGNYAILEFHQKSGASKALEMNQHSFGGCTVEVKPRKFIPLRGKGRDQSMTRKESTSTDDKAPLIDANALMEKIQNCQNLDAQMQTLMSELELTKGELRLRSLIVDMLQTVFEEFFPGCEVHQFGSSVNGFGVQGCDLDIFLDFNLEKPPTKPPDPSARSKQMPYVGDIQSLRGSRGLLNKDQLGQVSQADLIRLISRIIIKSAPGCTNVIAISNARCPVVKFMHESSGLQCDISINNRLALQNTRLLQLYCSICPLLRPLMFSLRYFFKVKQMSRTEKQGPQISNYALCLMVLAYLQHKTIVPSVEQLASQCAPGDKIEIEGWDCSFVHNVDEVQQQSTLDELFAGFFEYYMEFDFNSHVVCPRSGSSADVSEFANKIDIAEHLKDFKVTPVCVQDPFVLNHNTAATVNDKMKTKIVEEFIVAHRKCKAHQFGCPSAVDSWGLKYVLSHELPAGGVSADTALVIQLPLSSIQGTKAAQRADNASFPILLKSSQLSHESNQQLLKHKNWKLLWCDRVCRFVCRLMEEVLGFNCTMIREQGIVCDCVKIPHAVQQCAVTNGAKRSSPEILKGNESKRPKQEEAITGQLTDTPTDSSSQSFDDSNGNHLQQHINVAETDQDLLQAMFKTGKSNYIKNPSPPKSKPGQQAATSESVSDISSPFLNQMDHDQFNQNTTLSHKTDVQCASTALTDKNILYEIQCTTLFAVWEGRKKVKQKLANKQSTEDCIEIEKLITNGIKSNQQKLLPKPISLKLILTAEDTNARTCTKVEVTDSDGKFAMNFAEFLKPFIMRMVYNYLE